jgi:hypothetical protein
VEEGLELFVKRIFLGVKNTINEDLEVAQVVEYLPSKQEALIFQPPVLFPQYCSAPPPKKK